MSDKKPIIVLAGNYREFAEYAKGDKRYIFGDRPEKMRGHDVAEVIEIGTFYMRKDAKELRAIAQAQVCRGV